MKSNVNWQEILGWTDDQLEELRFSGFSFLREGRYEKAKTFFEALVVLNPENVYDLQTLGALYLELGQTKKALKTLDAALKIEPEHEPTLINKVKVFLALNQKEEAFVLADRLTQTCKDLTIKGEASALMALMR